MFGAYYHGQFVKDRGELKNNKHRNWEERQVRQSADQLLANSGARRLNFSPVASEVVLTEEIT